MKVGFIIIFFFIGCIKYINTGAPDCANIKQVYRYNQKLVIDFGLVCGSELTRFLNYPRFSQVAPGCDTTEIELLISF